MNQIVSGAKAPQFKTEDILGGEISLEKYKGKKVLLSFYRYASCPLCNLRVNQLLSKYEDWNDRGLIMVAFFESPKESILQYVGQQGAPFPIVPDPDRIVYSRYGVQGDIGKFLSGVLLHPGKLMSAAKKGFLPGRMENDYTMIPADFLIDEQGIVHTAYYGKDASDHLNIEIIDSFTNKS